MKPARYQASGEGADWHDIAKPIKTVAENLSKPEVANSGSALNGCDTQLQELH